MRIGTIGIAAMAMALAGCGQAKVSESEAQNAPEGVALEAPNASDTPAQLTPPSSTYDPTLPHGLKADLTPSLPPLSPAPTPNLSAPTPAAPAAPAAQ